MANKIKLNGPLHSVEHSDNRSSPTNVTPSGTLRSIKTQHTNMTVSTQNTIKSSRSKASVNQNSIYGTLESQNRMLSERKSHNNNNNHHHHVSSSTKNNTINSIKVKITPNNGSLARNNLRDTFNLHSTAPSTILGFNNESFNISTQNTLPTRNPDTSQFDPRSSVFTINSVHESNFHDVITSNPNTYNTNPNVETEPDFTTFNNEVLTQIDPEEIISKPNNKFRYGLFECLENKKICLSTCIFPCWTYSLLIGRFKNPKSNLARHAFTLGGIPYQLSNIQKTPNIANNNTASTKVQAGSVNLKNEEKIIDQQPTSGSNQIIQSNQNPNQNGPRREDYTQKMTSSNFFSIKNCIKRWSDDYGLKYGLLLFLLFIAGACLPFMEMIHVNYVSLVIFLFVVSGIFYLLYEVRILVKIDRRIAMKTMNDVWTTICCACCMLCQGANEYDLDVTQCGEI